MEPYITMTAHYLTATWEMKAKVLRTCLMPKRHANANIAQRLTDTIREWGLVVFCVIHNNASSMNLAMTLCEDFSNDLGCTGHTLQLAIKAGLDLPEVAKAIDAARQVVKSHLIQLLRDGEADQPAATGGAFDDAPTDIDEDNNNGEEPGKKKTRLESDYEELFGPHYASKKVKRRHLPRGGTRISPDDPHPHDEQPSGVVGTQ
ncbi:hypothetical protein AAFF_G00382610 [Aldrovandia affinis]|uniref:Uncharacterized protein n=1 Tax=Aldrovandia affinis TaxID=143900 RepID=A0AAD7T887_9TELE|nr:hypothetical protein AAFF_G00382610 [Aldrovandia affinis]